MTFFGERGDWSAGLPANAHGNHGHDDDHGHGDHAVKELPPVMLVPLAVLALGATFAGMAFLHLFIGGGYELFVAAIPVPWPGKPHSRRDGARPGACLGSADPVHAGRARNRLLHVPRRSRGAAAPRRRDALALPLPAPNKRYFDELYDLVFVRPAFAIGRLFWKGGDGAVIDSSVRTASPPACLT